MKRLLPLALFLTFAAPAHAGTGPPTASEIAGTLAAPGARHGVVWLTFNAADDDGLRRATLSVDGIARSVRLDDGAVWSALAVELTWDTAAVHDGVHVVSAQVEDLAGNAGFAFGPAVITTDNEPPIAGTVAVTRSAGTLTAAPNGFDGQDVEYAYRWQRCDPVCDTIDGATHALYGLTAADAGQSVRAVVTATDLGGTTTARSPQVAVPAAPSPDRAGCVVPGPLWSVAAAGRPTPATASGVLDRRATTADCATGSVSPAANCAAPTPPAGCAAPDPATPSAAFAPPAPARPRVVLAWRTLRAHYGERIEIAGRVGDADGRPLAGATVDVRSTLRVPGATARGAGSVGSARDGRFIYVAPAGASRDLEIGGSMITLLVRATGTFRATRNGRIVTLRGQLRGGHVPPGGVLVELSANGRTVRLVRTDARGAFHARVPAGATKRSFRAVARKDRSWPFVPVPLGSPVSA